MKVLIQYCTKLYTRKYSPQFYFAPFNPHFQLANLDLADSYVSDYLSSNITLSRRIEDDVKLFANIERRKLHRAKKNFIYRYTEMS